MRRAAIDPLVYAYERIETIADHLHYSNTKTIRAGIGTPEEDLVGGGHAHCGTMVYLGDNWPDEWGVCS